MLYLEGRPTHVVEVRFSWENAGNDYRRSEGLQPECGEEPAGMDIREKEKVSTQERPGLDSTLALTRSGSQSLAPRSSETTYRTAAGFFHADSVHWDPSDGRWPVHLGLR